MTTYFHRIFLCTLFLCLLSPLTSQAETLQLTLNEGVSIAIKHNPKIEIARQQYLGNQGVLTQAKSSSLPQLSGGLGYGRQAIDNLNPVDEDNVGSAFLQISQLIYDFGKTTGMIDASSFNLQASSENLIQAHHDLVFQVKEKFYTALEQERLIGVAQEAVSNYEQQLHRAQVFYNSGVKTKIDVTNAEVNLSNQKLQLLHAKADYNAALVNLEKVLGTVLNNGDYKPVNNEPPLSALAAQKPPMPGALDNLLQSADKNRPGLKEYAYLISAAEAGLTQAKGDYWPTIDAVGSYDNVETDLASYADNWQITARLNWKFFSGFATDGKVAEATAQLRGVQAGLRDFQLEVTRDVTDSYLRAEENREGVDIAEQTLKLANENLQLATERYQVGLGDLLEFNDAQLLYTQNQSSLVGTYYQYLTALARIDQAVGITSELAGYDLTVPLSRK